MVRWGPRGAVQALGVLQVDQRDAATVGQEAVSLLLIREAGVDGGMLLSQQGALSPVTLHPISRRLKAANFTVTEGEKISDLTIITLCMVLSSDMISG